jgi:RNA polymerase sigma-70 factor (ECF subfamily)
MTEPLPSHLSPTDDVIFDALVRAHYGRLCNFAYRFVGSRDVAEDIVQDVFVRLWQNRESFDVRDPLPYLYQSVRNRAVSHQRQILVRERWREQAAVAAQERHAGSSFTEAEAGELANAVARAVEGLPERCRLIFTMSREQDLTYAEIAGVLGISIKTVETQMGRALKSLRAALAGYLSVVVAFAGRIAVGQ